MSEIKVYKLKDQSKDQSKEQSKDQSKDKSNYFIKRLIFDIEFFCSYKLSQKSKILLVKLHSNIRKKSIDNNIFINDFKPALASLKKEKDFPKILTEHFAEYEFILRD